MRYAIFADIHNNIAALEAVLAHIETQAVDACFCLGDVGIDSCVDLVRAAGAPTVFGNWEVSNWRYLSPENQAWALGLPPLLKKETFWLTHAGLFWSPRLKTLADLNDLPHLVPRSKLFPYLHFEQDALWETVATLTEVQVSLMFHGHTHRQLTWRFSANNQLRRLAQRSVTAQPGDTLIVGVGSVGMPQDGPGAAYVIYDDKVGTVEMVRIKTP
jgi:predicted phosphodiesterase